MKIIDKDLLIKVIEESSKDSFDKNDLTILLEDYGDDWYIVDGSFQLCKKSVKNTI